MISRSKRFANFCCRPNCAVHKQREQDEVTKLSSPNSPHQSQTEASERGTNGKLASSTTQDQHKERTAQALPLANLQTRDSDQRTLWYLAKFQNIFGP